MACKSRAISLVEAPHPQAEQEGMPGHCVLDQLYPDHWEARVDDPFRKRKTQSGDHDNFITDGEGLRLQEVSSTHRIPLQRDEVLLIERDLLASREPLRHWRLREPVLTARLGEPAVERLHHLDVLTREWTYLDRHWSVASHLEQIIQQRRNRDEPAVLAAHAFPQELEAGGQPFISVEILAEMSVHDTSASLRFKPILVGLGDRGDERSDCSKPRRGTIS